MSFLPLSDEAEASDNRAATAASAASGGGGSRVGTAASGTYSADRAAEEAARKAAEEDDEVFHADYGVVMTWRLLKGRPVNVDDSDGRSILEQVTNKATYSDLFTCILYWIC